MTLSVRAHIVLLVVLIGLGLVGLLATIFPIIFMIFSVLLLGAATYWMLFMVTKDIFSDY